jgi:hypothetical protein
MRSARSSLVALALPLALASIGCGGAEKIPAATATAFTADLDAIEQRVRAGECTDARAALGTLQGRVRELPRDTDPNVRGTLSKGAEHLEELVGSECKQKPEPVDEPVTQAPEAPAPEQPQTVTAPEQPAVDEPVETQPAKPEKPRQPKEPEQPQEPDTPSEPTQPEEPTDAEKDICGDSPSPRC